MFTTENLNLFVFSNAQLLLIFFEIVLYNTNFLFVFRPSMLKHLKSEWYEW